MPEALKDSVGAATFAAFASIINFTGISNISKQGSNSFVITANQSQRDYVAKSKTSYVQQIIWTRDSEVLKMDPVIPDPTILQSSVSPSKKKQVLLKQPDDKKRFLVIPGSSSVDLTKMHGPFYADNYFCPSIAWNRDETKIAYVAEALLPNDEQDDGKFEYYQDAGEGYTAKRRPVLVLANLETNELCVLDNIHPSLFGAAQPIFFNDRLYFVGLLKEPVRLGVKFCTNRNASLFSCNFDGSDFQRHGQEGRSVRFPQLTPDGTSLVYLCNPLGGPHDSCATLVQLADDKESIVVNEVDTPMTISDFPGLFSYSLQPDCFLETAEKETVVLLTSAWRSRTCILAVNLKTRAIENLTTEGTDSWSFQACTSDGQVFAFRSSFNQPPCLLTMNYNHSKTWITLAKPDLNAVVSTYLDSLAYRISPIPKKSTNLEVIYISSTAKVHSFASHVRPLICMPHGGPHGCISTSFSIAIASFASLGFDVCCINYTGSTGFGNASIKALVGNIGQLDIEDVHAASMWAAAQPGVSQSNVFLHGGSHGGFINGHLVCREHQFYNAACIRNPVINVGANPYDSDIPDWSFNEAGLSYSPGRPLMPNAQEYHAMYAASPMSLTTQSSPVLLHLGANDRRVPHSQGLRWAESIQGRGGECVVYVFPGTGHALDSLDAERVGFESCVSFFVQKLKM